MIFRVRTNLSGLRVRGFTRVSYMGHIMTRQLRDTLALSRGPPIIIPSERSSRRGQNHESA
jgi:hypothetical protein